MTRSRQDERPYWVYRLYAADGELVYVGKSVSPSQRIADHRTGYQQARSKTWMSRVVRSELTRFENEILARDAEAKAIATEKPTENRCLPLLPGERYRVGRKPRGLKVRCTDHELERWHKKARNTGMTLSDLVRSLLDGVATER